MAPRAIVVGGGAGGIGAAGAFKGAQPDGEVIVFTEFEDAAYSPCGIPYVHGKEIPNFESLFLATKEAYVEQGIDIRYETRVAVARPEGRHGQVEGQGDVGYDRLIVATGFDYADPGVPGTDLEGLYYVKNIRRAMEWDKVLDDVKVGRRRRGHAARAGDGHRARPPGHRDPRHRPPAVGAQRPGRPRHRPAGRGLVDRDGRQDALRRHAGGVRRRRQDPRRAHVRRRAARRPRRDLHEEGARTPPSARPPA